jgi:hypothetical protein
VGTRKRKTSLKIDQQRKEKGGRGEGGGEGQGGGTKIK